MYIPKHFEPQELVPPAIFDARGDKSLELIDDRVLITLDKLRNLFGPCTINNWPWGGLLTQSGLRTSDAKEYSPTSQHTFGRAMDCKFENTTAAQIRKYLISHLQARPYITFIEDDVNWFHFDVRNCQPLTIWSKDTGKMQTV